MLWLCSDYAFSICVGLGLTTVILYFNAKSDQVEERLAPEKGERDTATEKEEEETGKEPLHTRSESNQLSKVYINERHAMEKLGGIGRFLNLSEEQLQQAIRDTNNEIACTDSDELSDDNDPYAVWRRFLDTVLFLVAIGGLIYALNVVSNGDVGRIFGALFPKEFESLKIKDYLDNLHYSHFFR